MLSTYADSVKSAQSRDPIDVDRLAGSNRLWRRIEVVEETGSSNADLLARDTAGEDVDGAVLLAESQTGRAV